MSHKVPKWKIRDDKHATLIQRFKARFVMEHNILSTCFTIPATSGKRLLFDGEWTIREENVRKLFAGLLKFSAWEADKLTEEQEAVLQETIMEFCLMEDPPERNSRPRSSAKTEHFSSPERNSSPILKQMVVFVKFLHLRDNRKSPPVYRKYVQRTQEEYDVYDEFMMVRTLSYDEEVKDQKLRGRSKEGIVDLLPIFPVRDSLLVPDKNSAGMPELVEHLERKQTSLMQSVYTYVNGFQYGQENVSFIIPSDCQHVVVVVDMTSLVPNDRSKSLLLSEPTAHHVRLLDDGGTTQLRMHCSMGSTGAFIVDSQKNGESTDDTPAWDALEHDLMQDDYVDIRLHVDWEQVQEPNRIATFPDLSIISSQHRV